MVVVLIIFETSYILTGFHVCNMSYLTTDVLWQTLDLSFVKMVYSTSYFKGLATGGNVSKAMVSVSLFLAFPLSQK